MTKKVYKQESLSNQVTKKVHKQESLSNQEFSLWLTAALDPESADKLSAGAKDHLESLNTVVATLEDSTDITIKLIENAFMPIFEQVKDIHLLRYIIQKELNIDSDKMADYRKEFDADMEKSLEALDSLEKNQTEDDK